MGLNFQNRPEKCLHIRVQPSPTHPMSERHSVAPDTDIMICNRPEKCLHIRVQPSPTHPMSERHSVAPDTDIMICNRPEKCLHIRVQPSPTHPTSEWHSVAPDTDIMICSLFHSKALCGNYKCHVRNHGLSITFPDRHFKVL